MTNIEFIDENDEPIQDISANVPDPAKRRTLKLFLAGAVGAAGALIGQDLGNPLLTAMTGDEKIDKESANEKYTRAIVDGLINDLRELDPSLNQYLPMRLQDVLRLANPTLRTLPQDVFEHIYKHDTSDVIVNAANTFRYKDQDSYTPSPFIAPMAYDFLVTHIPERNKMSIDELTEQDRKLILPSTIVFTNQGQKPADMVIIPSPDLRELMSFAFYFPGDSLVKACRKAMMSKEKIPFDMRLQTAIYDEDYWAVPML